MIEDKREGLVGASGFQPLTSWIPTRRSTPASLFARRWDPAIEQLHRAIEINQTFGSVIVFSVELMSRKESCRRPLLSFNGRSNWKRIMPRPSQAWDMHMRCREPRRSAKNPGSFKRGICA